MDQQPLELRKSRDFGQIINDSFTFLKENFKPLFKSLLIICGIFVVIATVSTVAQYMSMLNLFGAALVQRSPDAYTVTQGMTFSYVFSAAFSALIYLLLDVFIYLTTFSYMSVYLQKSGEKPTFVEVWGYFRYYFFRVMGGGIVMFVLICVGFVFCFIPGIYLAIVFHLVIPIIVMENASFSYAFNKSFRLIKENWWFVFGVTFVSSLIVGVISGVASMPLSILPIAAQFFANKSYTTPMIIIFSIIRCLLMLTYVLPAVAIALCYFKLSEEKEGLGLLKRIEGFGQTNRETPEPPTGEY